VGAGLDSAKEATRPKEVLWFRVRQIGMD
jgi:hypothetical protein